MMGATVMVAEIATGKIVERTEGNSGRVRSGGASGKARVEKLAPRERATMAKKAASSRWR